MGLQADLAEVHPDPCSALFAEDGARALVCVREGAEAHLEAMASRFGLPLLRLGTTGGDTLDFKQGASLSLDSLSRAYRSGFAEAVGLEGQ